MTLILGKFINLQLKSGGINFVIKHHQKTKDMAQNAWIYQLIDWKLQYTVA